MSVRGIQIMAGILAATLAGASFAAEIQPGLWELVVENRGLDSPDVTSEPITISRCLTEEDAQDPSGVLGGVANPGMADCTYTQRSFSGNTFRFKMRCDGSLGLQARGEVTYSAISMDGSIISMANMDGQAIMLESKITARRRGGC